MKEADRAEGRRLWAEYDEALKQWSDEFSAHNPDAEKFERNAGLKKIWLKHWMFENREALLADPWRPIEELPEEFKDGRPVMLGCDYDRLAKQRIALAWWAPNMRASEVSAHWVEAYHVDEDTYEYVPHHVEFRPTHFRVIEPPGGEG